MRAVSSLEVGEWILYEYEQSERIGRIAETGDPLTILPPGGDENLAEEIAPTHITAEWIPEGHYPGGRPRRARRIDRRPRGRRLGLSLAPTEEPPLRSLPGGSVLPFALTLPFLFAAILSALLDRSLLLDVFD